LYSSEVQPFPNLDYGPERLFGVNSFDTVDGLVVGTMNSNVIGSLEVGIGVLVDDVLGYAIVAARPENCWSVSTAIAIDFVRPVPDSGSLRAQGRLAFADSSGGYATGEVIGSDGQVVAHCRQRGRFVPLANGLAPPPGLPNHDQAEGLGDLYDLLGLRATADDTLTIDISPIMHNPMGNLHGGVSLAIATWLAGAENRRRDSQLAVTSVHINFVRPSAGGSEARFAATRTHSGRSLALTTVVGTGSDGKARTITTVTHG
jgi:acyl-coenzyme A thioesterase PaaI-like protein